MNSRGTFALIHERHLIQNYHLIRQAMAPGAFLCPMIKADAYGHSAVAVARWLEKEGQQHFGVALIEEAIELRKHGVHNSLLHFGGFYRDALDDMIQYRVTPVLSDWSHVEIIEKRLEKGEGLLPVHIKFNTGMNRLGFDVEDAISLIDRLKKCPVRIEGVLTHLACGEDLDDSQGFSAQQLAKFNQVKSLFSSHQPFFHVLNSAAFLRSKAKSEGARPGLLLYGVSPIADHPEAQDFKMVMSFRSQIMQIRSIKSGESVSYGLTWRSRRPSLIGVIPVGYADGYPRLLSNKSSVLILGRRAPVVGRVCMDYLMVDLTDVGVSRDQLLGQEVTLFGYDDQGSHLSPVELAELAQTIPYEILTGVSHRVPRVTEARL